MCGRYYIDEETARAIEELVRGIDRDLRAERLGIMKSGDVMPHDMAPVIVASSGHLSVKRQQWGFPGLAGKGIIINARAETALEKQMFCDGVLSRRAVIPASKFYEWNRNRDRITFMREDGGRLFMAGFYNRFEDGDHYMILTTAANESMVQTHGRMPLLLEQSQVKSWILDGSKTREFLRQKPAPLSKEAEYEQISLMGL